MEDGRALPSGAETLAEMMKGAGSFTFAVVSRESLRRGCGLERGFDSYDDEMLGAPQGIGLERNRLVPDVLPAADRSLRAAVDRPFLGWVHLSDLAAEKGELAVAPGGKDSEVTLQPDDRRRPSVLEDVALLLARLLDTLDQAGVADRTLVIVGAPSSHDLSDGMGARAVLLSSRQVATPLLVSLPGVVPQGARCEAPVSLMDVTRLVRSLVGDPGTEGPAARDLLSLSRGIDASGPPVVSVSMTPWIWFGLSPLLSVANGTDRLILSAGERWELLSWHGAGEAMAGAGQGSEGVARFPAAEVLLQQARRDLGDVLAAVAAPRTARDPREAQAFGTLLLARRLLLSGDDSVARAARLLQSPAAEALGAPALPWLKARLLLLRDDPEGALVASREALEFYAGSVAAEELQRLEIEILLAGGHVAEAASRAERARGIFPRSPRLLALQARALLEGGDGEASLALLTSAAAPRSAETWFVAGSIHEEAGRPDEAVNAFRRSLRLDPNRKETRARVGRLLLSLGRFAEAAEELIAASNVGRDDPDPALAYECGRALEGMGDAESAILAYETSRRNGLEVQASTWRIGFLLSMIGQTDAALAELRALARQEPSFDLGYRDLVRLLLEKGELDEALRWARVLVERFGEKGASHLLLGMTLSRLGREDEALASLRASLALDPAPRVGNELAWLLLTAGDEGLRRPEEALALAREVVRKEPEGLDYADTLARALLVAGSDEEARSEVRRVGEALLEAGRRDEARSLLGESRHRFPDDPELDRLLRVSEGRGPRDGG